MSGNLPPSLNFINSKLQSVEGSKNFLTATSRPLSASLGGGPMAAAIIVTAGTVSALSTGGNNLLYNSKNPTDQKLKIRSAQEELVKRRPIIENCNSTGGRQSLSSSPVVLLDVSPPTYTVLGKSIEGDDDSFSQSYTYYRNSDQLICRPIRTRPPPTACSKPSCVKSGCRPPSLEEDDDDGAEEEKYGTIINDEDVSEDDGGDASSIEDLEDAFEEEIERQVTKTHNNSSNKRIKEDPDKTAKRTIKELKKESRQRWDADSLKHYSNSASVSEFAETARMGCNAECSFDKKCLSYVDIEEMYKLKEHFWGKPHEKAYLPKKRREKIHNIFNLCHANQHATTDRLTFQIRDKFGKKRFICEAAFLFQLGYIRSRDASSANSMWKAYKKFHFDGGMKDVRIDIAAKRADGRAKSEKLIDAELYIRRQMLMFGDKLPTKEGTNKDGKPVYVLPYERSKDFFQAYLFDAELTRTHPSKIARYTCFRKAFKSLEDEIRLLGCKGSLPTCSVCNTAHEMMRNKSAWSDQQRKIVLQFLRLHLKQQQTERLRLEYVKKICAEEYDERGNPKHAFIYSDAMTESKGDTPKEGATRHSSPGKVIKNRLFAIQVVCGPIDAILYVSVDQTISGGANLAVEIQRVAIAHLTKMLADRKLLFPRSQFWQFDNCGENKNKIMFCYASLLVEAGYANEIQLGFLIVGHTHCNLDQNFSVLSKKIDDVSFIGSPLALHELYQSAHKKEEDRPVLNIQLQYVYDWKGHFKDILNKDIKYFQVPHRFRIFLHPLFKRSVCQYMLFTNEDLVTEEWLPKATPMRPESSSVPKEFLACSIQLYDFAIINGLPTFECFLGLKGEFSKMSAKAKTNTEMSSEVSSFMDMLPHLMELEKRSLAAQMTYNSSQANGEFDIVSPVQLELNVNRAKAQIQREMLRENNHQYGYLLWLDFTRVENTDYNVMVRPKLLPYIPPGPLNPDDSRCKGLFEAARTISSVASRVIYEWDHKTLNKVKDPNKSIAEATFDFSKRMLHISEYNWFKKRETWEDVINIIRKAQDDQKQRDSPWELMSLSGGSDEGILLSDIHRDILKQRLEMINILRLGLVRKRQDRLGEVLSRQGLNAATAAPVKCIFGFNLESDGCLEKASHNCETCSAFCCELHKLHETHQDMVADSNTLLRQQIAASAATVSSNNNAAISTLSNNEQNDGTDGASKKLRRNTRKDLENRYIAVTGKIAVESKYSSGQMVVKDFQRIVEGLERENNGGGNLPFLENIVDQQRTSKSPALAPAASQQSTTIVQSTSVESSTSELTQLLTLIKSNPGILNFLSAVSSASGSSSNPVPLVGERALNIGDCDQDDDDV